MNHGLIIKSILESEGVIYGGYIREWLINKKPCDTGWEDIDIKCPQEKQSIISEKINKINSNIKLDFTINYHSKPGCISPYSFNLFKYNGNIEVIDFFKKYKSLWLDGINKKICYIVGNPLDRKKQFEKFYKNSGWIFV